MSTYHLKNSDDYQTAYQNSINDPIDFWANIAKNNFDWHKPWDTVFDWHQDTAKIQWFKGGRLNITENLLDRHLAQRGQSTALIFEPNDPSEPHECITYQALYLRVNKMANVLKSQGVKKGDRVCIYLPMIPELAISVLACAKIGAEHAVVFGGFSATALATRINDCDCRLVITSDGGFRGAKIIDLKDIVDEALEACPGVATVLVVERIKTKIRMKEGRDQWLAPLFNAASDH